LIIEYSFYQRFKGFQRFKRFKTFAPEGTDEVPAGFSLREHSGERDIPATPTSSLCRGCGRSKSARSIGRRKPRQDDERFKRFKRFKMFKRFKRLAT